MCLDHFFFVHTNDLPSSNSFETIRYAVGVALIFSDDNEVDLKCFCKIELIKVFQWTECNNIKLNFKKTQCLYFTNKSMKNNFNSLLTLGQTIVSQTNFV